MTTNHTREALIDLLVMTRLADFVGTDLKPVRETADAILQSDWLAAHVAKAAAEHDPAAWMQVALDERAALRRVEIERDEARAENERLTRSRDNVLEAAERDRAELRAENERLRASYRDLTRRLGFGDNITEPQADNDIIIAWVDEQVLDASEWQESQRWRIECQVAKGHDPLNDCYECDPALRLDAALAQLGAIAALVEKYESSWEPDAVRIGDRIRTILADSAGATAKHEQEVRAATGERIAQAIEALKRDAMDDCTATCVIAYQDATRDAANAARADALTEGPS